MKIMSTLTMSASGQHVVVSQVTQNSNKDFKSLPSVTYDLSDGNTLVAVYCFIKNFIGASGSSTVAIDNKIEQAMDLVKSHLMFAVREEVEVLKERITELSDRINQLEHENTILRSHATQETLSQLCTAVSSKPPVSTGTSSNPATFDGRL